LVRCKWWLVDTHGEGEGEEKDSKSSSKSSSKVKEVKMEVTVPPNTKAVVVVPGVEGEREVGSGVREFRGWYDGSEWPPRAYYHPMQPRDDDDDI
jgi:hypothetical protein